MATDLLRRFQGTLGLFRHSNLSQASSIDPNLDIFVCGGEKKRKLQIFLSFLECARIL